MELTITTKNTSTADLLSDLREGMAQVHSVREDGTTRRRHFLTEGTKEREVAEWVRLQREGQEADEAEGVLAVTPRSMRSIANEMHISIPAVRRILIDLAITEELEEADNDELAAMVQGAEEAN